MPIKTPSVTIAIPTMGRNDLVQHCVRSIAHQSIAHDEIEVVIVHNVSEPAAFSAGCFDFSIQEIFLQENLGTTGSINVAARQSQAKYLLLLNNDVECDSRFLEELTSFLGVNPDYGFAIGKLLSARNRTMLDGAGDALLLGGGAYRLGHGDCDNHQFDRQSGVLSGGGAALLFRRELFESIGGLDEDFFAYLDDVDLCLRAVLRGCPGRYVPTAIAYHLGSETLGDVYHPKIIELLTRNQILLHIKNLPLALQIRVLPRSILFQVLWLLNVTRHKQLGSYARGLWGAVRLLPIYLRKRSSVLRGRKIANPDLLRRLKESEQQIRAWHFSRPLAQRSTLLNLYFRLSRAEP